MRTLSMIICLMLALSGLRAQEVTFRSDDFAFGVRRHLGLPDDRAVLQEHTDTITSIDLSGLMLTDISDVSWLPNVKKINLRGNRVGDLSPLLQLDSLRYLNLKENALEDIDLLAFTHVDSMWVNVANNHITDFSRLYNPSVCHFILEGMGAQTPKNAPQWNVHQFFSDINSDGKCIVTYMGTTSNVTAKTYIKCGASKVTAKMDGEFYDAAVPGNPQVPSEVMMTCGSYLESTWALPVRNIVVAPTEAKTIDLGLPDSYTLGYVSALYGAATVSGSSLFYKAPAELQNDTLFFSFYEGTRIKGFSKIAVGAGAPMPTQVDALAAEKAFGAVWRDGRLWLSTAVLPEGATAQLRVFDAAGRLLLTQELTSEDGNSAGIQLPPFAGAVVIAELSFGGRRYVSKCAVAN